MKMDALNNDKLELILCVACRLYQGLFFFSPHLLHLLLSPLPALSSLSASSFLNFLSRALHLLVEYSLSEAELVWNKESLFCSCINVIFDGADDHFVLFSHQLLQPAHLLTLDLHLLHFKFPSKGSLHLLFLSLPSVHQDFLTVSTLFLLSFLLAFVAVKSFSNLLIFWWVECSFLPNLPCKHLISCSFLFFQHSQPSWEALLQDLHTAVEPMAYT